MINFNNQQSFSNFEDTNVSLKYGFYLVHVSPQGYRVIAKSDKKSRLCKGDDFREILSYEAQQEMHEYLRGYEKAPMILRTDSGSACIFPNTFSSTSIFLVAFVNSEKHDWLVSAFSKTSPENPPLYHIFTSDSLKRHIRKRDVLVVEEFVSVSNNITDIFKNAWFTVNDDANRSVNKLYSIIESTAKLLLCPIEVCCCEDIVCDDSFDTYAFAAFLFSLFILWRNHGSSAVKIELTAAQYGAAIEISFDTSRSIPRLTTPEISTIYSFAERNNMLFEYSSSEKSLKTKFSPIRKDWSLLELKSDPQFNREG